MNGMRGDPELLTVVQVQEVLGIGRSKVYELVAQGQLPVLRIGRLVRVPRVALDRWIEANTRRRGEAA